MKKLSKSKYILGLQCPKALWLRTHSPELEAPPDEDTKHRFEMGHLVGEYAQRCFVGGVLIAEDHMHLTEAIKSTEMAIADGATALYEATAAFDNTLSRADILLKTGKGRTEWDIYEVKSATKVKDYYLEDVSFQRRCFEGAGYIIRKTYLMHVNNEYVRHGEIDPEGLLITEDITADVRDTMTSIDAQIENLLAMINLDKCPEVAPGKQCKNPFTCGFFDLCNKREPYDIYEIPRGGKRIAELEAMGVRYLKDIPDDMELTVRQRSVVTSAQRGEVVIDRVAIREFLDTLEYPLCFFDFETIAHAVPFFDDSRPYEAIPFQFSLHIQEKKDGPVLHHEFLHNEKNDPRRPLVQEMVRLLGKKGSIVAWFMSYEKMVIENMATDLPEYADELRAFLPRFRDLIVPFQAGSYAHRDFHGSASLKSVLPVLVPSLSYGDLEIQEGTGASLAYERWMMGQMPDEQWRGTRDALLKYCELDTLAMVEILKVVKSEM